MNYCGDSETVHEEYTYETFWNTRPTASAFAFALSTSSLTRLLNSGSLSLSNTTFSSLRTRKSASMRLICCWTISLTVSCNSCVISLNPLVQSRRWSLKSDGEPNVPVMRFLRRRSLPVPRYMCYTEMLECLQEQEAYRIPNLLHDMYLP